ncbi:RagB/SusD family nutrient uptake outer membrane protein [Aestuariibaculum suncheonense]|uniref:RagB/SusD family nutrient uptake outer membrane protein n=1 Tax=Aestuariibaculum suncheonense TaxID=1028745 RepID=A0A8J6UG67_9FLAO|nr:RagB/SusD family nutrient uptake outer membrane protein [Aestuariibaculum suncheonense]MBD0834794.1 RagB/SusD family nutrient uptake outer membrane protein [Aestuariibaculum suncheonense]
MKKYRLFLQIIASLSFVMISCEEVEIGDNFLSKPPGGDVTIDSVYANLENAEGALTSAYATLPYGLPVAWQQGRDKMNMDILESLTDLSQSYLTWGGVNRFYYSGTYDAGLENWNNHTKYNYYKEGSWLGIRRAYTFIENIDRVPDADQATIDRLKGEALMIIAVQYAEMFRYYGGLPWVNKAFKATDDTYTPRMTAEATMDSIVGVIDRAAALLPWEVEDLSNNEGRFTRAAAKALKVRVLLFGASPLFNSTQPFREGEASDLKMTWFGDYDADHWQNVVDACEDFINDLQSNGFYSLVNTGNPRQDFKSGYYDRGLTEILITTRDRFRSNWGYYFYQACNFGIARPSQELVDMYPMANGKSIDDPTSGYDASNPYINRDPRLYETVLVNGDSYVGRKAELYIGGRERTGQNVPGAGSGYRLRKFFLDGNAATSINSVVQYPYLRLPEVYLSYAEALNELNDGPTAKAYEYLNKTRQRVGVGDAPTGLTKEQFREEVLTERAREFAFEEIRWFDLVRWKMPFIQPHGMNITRDNATGNLSYEVFETTPKRAWVESWDTKWYLNAFPSDEVNKDYGLVQNPGW